MKREIKFRAWDKTEKNMISWNGNFVWFSEKVENVGGEIDYNNFVIMQYTGLKDRNGKEIYEGDIVTNYAGHGIINPNQIVKYDKWRGYSIQGNLYSKNTIRVNDELVSASWIVLGNIYENPELLEKGVSK